MDTRLLSQSSQMAGSIGPRDERVHYLVSCVLDQYLNQGRINNLQACIDFVWDAALRESAPSFSRRTLRRWVDRAYKEEKWDRLFKEKKMKKHAQQYTPVARYENYDEVGTMDFWVMDGRKSDVLVSMPDRRDLVMPKGYFIREVRTGMIIGAALQPFDFSARDVIRLVVRTALQYGAPRVGIICDNGKEQLGSNNILAMESLWDAEYIQACRARAVVEISTRFENATSPVITSLPRIPTFFGKGAMERGFLTMQQRIDAFVGGNNFMGSGRAEQTHTTLMLSPRVDHATLSWQEFERLFNWYLFADPSDRRYGIPLHAQPRPVALRSFSRQTGMEPTIANAWHHALKNYEPMLVPEDNLLRLYTYTEERLEKRVTRDAQITFQHRGERWNFTCDRLSYLHTGERVSLILDPSDDTRALVLYKGEPVGIAVDLDRRRRQMRITHAEANHILSQVRRQKHREITQGLGSRRYQPKHSSPDAGSLALQPPMVPGGSSVEELMYAITYNENRLDETVESEISIDDVDAELLGRYLHPDLNN